jgi:hypothetical protein
MEPRPVQRPNERMLAYYNRVNEWERRIKPLMAREARAIDSLNSKASITRSSYESAQQKLNRKTIHDYASENPVLLKIMRRMK